MSVTPRDRSQDPRDRITPDAFSVAPHLLGLPLASHGRRVGAILADLLLVAILTGVGGVFVAVVLAVLFFRLAVGRRRAARGAGSPAGTAHSGHTQGGKKAPAERSSIANSAMRATMGCMGAVVLFIAVVTAWGSIRSFLSSDQPSPPTVQIPDGAATPGLGDFLVGMQEVRGYRQADSPEEAARRARALAERLRSMGLEEDEVGEFLTELAPTGAGWRERIPEWAQAPQGSQAVGPAEEGVAPGAEALPDSLLPPGDASQEPAATQEDELGLLVDALESYAAMLAELGAAADESEGAEVFRALIAGALASDTIEALESRLADETRERLRAERALVAADRNEPGIRAWLRGIAEDLGLGFGWGAVYFTVFLHWWKGRTPGKRLFGLRVVRLDGQPIGWWIAFERYGGYAAGFATGLLGFLQVFWDPNRQAIHDRLAATVVVMDGRPPLPTRPVDLS